MKMIPAVLAAATLCAAPAFAQDDHKADMSKMTPAEMHKHCSMMMGAKMASGGDPTASGPVAMVLMLALLVGALVLLVFMFLEGTRGPNRYGADPKGQNAGQVFV